MKSHLRPPQPEGGGLACFVARREGDSRYNGTRPPHGGSRTMPVNRQGRAAVAEALAAFLRGELPAIELRQRVLASEADDDSIQDDYLAEFRETFSCGLYF